MGVTKTKFISCLAVINILFLSFCYQSTYLKNSNQYEVKLQAVAKAKAAQEVVGSRLLGEEYTTITTTLGAHDAKNLSTNPAFAAVITDMLIEAGVHKGDVVAVNMSGSFPALNIAAIAAVDSMEATPVIISSVGSSTWGANRPGYTWLDMEQTLIAKGIWQWRSSAVSIGGGGDRGRGLSEEGLKKIEEAIKRAGTPLLESQSLSEAINKRIELYRKTNKGILPSVLINVGGSHVIFGEHGHEAALHQGLTRSYRPDLARNNGLAAAFINSNRSVIHLINVHRLAAEYNIRNSTSLENKALQNMDVSVWMKVIIVAWLTGMLTLLYYSRKKAWWH